MPKSDVAVEAKPNVVAEFLDDGQAIIRASKRLLREFDSANTLLFAYRVRFEDDVFRQMQDNIQDAKAGYMTARDELQDVLVETKSREKSMVGVSNLSSLTARELEAITLARYAQNHFTASLQSNMQRANREIDTKFEEFRDHYKPDAPPPKSQLNI